MFNKLKEKATAKLAEVKESSAEVLDKATTELEKTKRSATEAVSGLKDKVEDYYSWESKLDDVLKEASEEEFSTFMAKKGYTVMKIGDKR